MQQEGAHSPSTVKNFDLTHFFVLEIFTTRTLKGTDNTDAKSKYTYDLKWTGNTDKHIKLLPISPFQSSIL